MSAGAPAAPPGAFFLPAGEAERVVVVARDPAAALGTLAGLLAPPYALVYVLLRSNTLRPEGRYQSMDAVSPEELTRFLQRFGPFLSADGRHGLAVVSAAEPAAATLDRRGVVELHGPAERAFPALRAAGFAEATPPEPPDRAIDPANDPAEAAVLASRRWTWFPLEPQDLVDEG